MDLDLEKSLVFILTNYLPDKSMTFFFCNHPTLDRMVNFEENFDRLHGTTISLVFVSFFSSFFW